MVPQPKNKIATKPAKKRGSDGGDGGGGPEVKYASPGSKRMQARIRRNRRKTKRVQRDSEPSWVRSLQRKYSGEEDPGYERIKRRQGGGAGSKHERDDDDNNDEYDDDDDFDKRYQNRDDGNDDSGSGSDNDDDDDDNDFEDVLEKNMDKRNKKLQNRRGKNKVSAADSKRGDDDDDEGLEVESEVDEDHIEQLNQAAPLTQQLFVRGIPKDCDDEAVKQHFAQFGEVKRVHVVQNRVTKRPSGSAFIHFVSDEAANAAYDAALRNAQEVGADIKLADKQATEGMSHHQAKKLMYKLQQDRFTSKEPFVTMQTSRVTVMRPLQRGEAQDMTSGGKSKKEKRTATGAEDPRNLYLLEEGLILPGTRAAESLHPKYLESLTRDYETRKQQLRNTNLFVSKTRLSVRNVPRNVTSEQLRKLFLDMVRDLLRSNPALRTKESKKDWGKHGPIRNLRLLVDRAGTSRGYGFVEFARHEYALHVLRHSNNNPTLFGANHRLVVAFAIENINALQKLDRLKTLRKEKMEQSKRSGFVDRPGDDIDPTQPRSASNNATTTTATASDSDNDDADGESKGATKAKAKKKDKSKSSNGAAASSSNQSGGFSILTTSHGVGAKPVLPSSGPAAAPAKKKVHTTKFSLSAHRAVQKKRAAKRKA